MAAKMTPIVSNATLKTCTRVYFLPQIQPTNIVVMLPPLRRIICTGTDIANPNAKLLSMLTVKNKKMFGSHRETGTVGFFKNHGGREAEKCCGHVKRVVITNWVKVMRRPVKQLDATSFHADTIDGQHTTLGLFTADCLSVWKWQRGQQPLQSLTLR